MVVARLQGDVRRRPLQVAAGLVEGVDLGMGQAGPVVPAGTGDAPALGDDATHLGVGVSGVAAPPRQFQGASHAGGIGFRPLQGSSSPRVRKSSWPCCGADDNSFSSCLISSEKSLTSPKLR